MNLNPAPLPAALVPSRTETRFIVREHNDKALAYVSLPKKLSKKGALRRQHW